MTCAAFSFLTHLGMIENFLAHAPDGDEVKIRLLQARENLVYIAA